MRKLIKPVPAPLGQHCAPHLARAGVVRLALWIVDDEPMCRDCILGKPVRHAEVVGDHYKGDRERDRPKI